MFKMQTDNHNFRKNVAANKRYILTKMNLKFQNSKFDISCKISFYIFFCYKLGLFGVKRSMKQHKWLNKILCFNLLKN